MDKPDPELSAMSQILAILDGLSDPAARTRVAEWVYQRATSSKPQQMATRIEPTANGPAAGRAVEAPIGSHRSVESFIRGKRPRTKTERFACLLFWASGVDGQDVRVSTLNELNRSAGGETFSDAASLGQNAIAKGYARRTSQGRFVLTPEGRDLVASLPPPAL